MEGFLTFDIKKELENLDKLIIKEWTSNSFYLDLNRWLYNLNINIFEPVAYFTSRLMYSLNSYAQKQNKYCVENEKILYGGNKQSYINLLPFERAIGKIIILSAFISTFKDKEIANRFSGRNNSKELYQNSLIFYNIFYKELL